MGHSNSKRFKKRDSKIRFVEAQNDPEESDAEKLGKFEEYGCYRVTGDSYNKSDEIIQCKLGGVPVKLLIDSGSKFNLISESDWNNLLKQKAVVWNVRNQSENQFRAYAANTRLEILKVFETPIDIMNRREVIGTFYVIKGGNQSLLGKDSALKLEVLKLGLNVYQIRQTDNLPTIKGVKIKLNIDESVKPVIQPVRRVPIALEKKIEQKLQEALECDIIEPAIGLCTWLSPVVIVTKANGDIRLCTDMRRANEAISRENLPFPRVETVLAKLSGCKYFSKLDLKNAFLQYELHPDSRYITTFVTHIGNFRHKRLPFGINSAAEQFQWHFAKLLTPVAMAVNFLDDVAVGGRTEKEHDENLEKVLKIFEENRVTLNKEKCVFKVKRIRFLGHILSGEGIQADPEKTDTILKFRVPNSKEELRSFLGLATYLSKFIADFSNITAPLRALLKEGVKFEWGEQQKSAFGDLKKSIARIPALSHFELERKTRLITDASPVALGAVLVQFESKELFLIAFASRALSDVEQRYSQTEKESLGLVWGVERFYYFLMGVNFELETDHKPLEAIFKPTSRPPARIERWVLRLQAYSYKVIYKAGKYNIADSLSRLCELNECKAFDQNCELNIYAIVEATVPEAIRISDLVSEMYKDEEVMEAVRQIQTNSWPQHSKSPYQPFRLELSLLGNILLRGNRLVIPKGLRNRVLELAHEGHPGEGMMKRRIRARVWWPLVDRDAEKFVKNCKDCLLVSQPNPPVPMVRHQFPENPWSFLAMDLLGPLPNNEYILVIIDYFSRYMELKFLRSIKSRDVINFMEELSVKHGLPKSVKADNGKQFVSEEFKRFCATNNIELVTSPPYWPQANGEVENMNRALVKRLKIAHENGKNYVEVIRNFQRMYNVTPHGTTGTAPSELLYKRVIRDKIPSVHDIINRPEEDAARDRDMINKEKGKEKGDTRRHAKESDIKVGDKVLVKNVIFPNKLTTTFAAKEYQVTGLKGADVVVEADGKSYRRNISHLKKIPEPETNGDETMFDTQETAMENQETSEESLQSEREQQTEKATTAGGTEAKVTPLKLRKMGEMWRPI